MCKYVILDPHSLLPPKMGNWTCMLTHLPLLPHAYISELVCIGSDNGLPTNMACRLFGAKPLYKPILAYCQLCLREKKLQWNSNQNTKFFIHGNASCIWNPRSAKWRSFCPGGLKYCAVILRLIMQYVTDAITERPKHFYERHLKTVHVILKMQFVQLNGYCGISLDSTGHISWEKIEDIPTII